MKTIATLFFFFGLSALSYSQTVKINQLDSAGKKTGKWIVYWDNAWSEVKDSSKASYYRYTYYDHGNNMYPMGPRDKKWKLVAFDSINQIGKLKLLNGDYKWYDEKGVLRDEDVFKNGEYISYKWYYPSGEISQVFDYTKHWQNQPYSWYIVEYLKSGEIKRETYANAKGYGEKVK